MIGNYKRLRMQIKNIMFSVLAIINTTPLYAMQKFQTYRARLIAEIREDQKNLNEQKKKMSQSEYQSFNHIKQLCNKDNISDNLNTLCPSCMKAFDTISVGTQSFLYAENALKQSIDHYNELYEKQPLYDPLNIYNSNSIHKL